MYAAFGNKINLILIGIIRHDKTKSFNYLVGRSSLLNDQNEAVAEVKISCFRLSRIQSIKSVSTSFLPKDNKLEIEKALNERGVQFMADEIVEVKVIFTRKGYDDFNRQIYMRPQNYKQINNLTYVFYCTEFQALAYFFKFGKDACIISPKRLHDKMMKAFASALSVYQDSDR